jgi:hypothetical protein
MLAALGNGVRGGKWFSLIDKDKTMNAKCATAAGGATRTRKKWICSDVTHAFFEA